MDYCEMSITGERKLGVSELECQWSIFYCSLVEPCGWEN